MCLPSPPSSQRDFDAREAENRRACAQAQEAGEHGARSDYEANPPVFCAARRSGQCAQGTCCASSRRSRRQTEEQAHGPQEGTEIDPTTVPSLVPLFSTFSSQREWGRGNRPCTLVDNPWEEGMIKPVGMYSRSRQGTAVANVLGLFSYVVQPRF